MSDYKALYEKQLEENKKLQEKLKTTQFISGMTVKKLAGSCKEAIDGDIKEAEKQIKHLTEKNKELQNDLNGLVTASEATFNGYKEAIEDLKTIAQDKHDALQTYIKKNKELQNDLKKAEDNLDEEMLKNEKLEVEVKKLKSTIIAKKALINHWKNKCDENKNLKEQVKYWKNFALFYWSGFQLGEEENSDSEVWREALEECDRNSECDTEALTKKCMEN